MPRHFQSLTQKLAHIRVVFKNKNFTHKSPYYH